MQVYFYILLIYTTNQDLPYEGSYPEENQ